MGNRTFLSIQDAGSNHSSYDDVAFETNNFIAPLWFSLMSEKQYQQYKQRLLIAWEALQPKINEEIDEDDEGPPEMEAFVQALNWSISWEEGSAHMKKVVSSTVECFPVLASYMSDWHETLLSHIQHHSRPVITLDLQQFFDFYEEPLEYLEAIESCLQLWLDPKNSWFASQKNKIDSYLLGGEHLPRKQREPEERISAQTEEHKSSLSNEADPSGEQQPIQQAPTTSAPAIMNADVDIDTDTGQPDAAPTRSASRRRSAKSNFWSEFGIWVLAVLSAALAIGTYLWTNNGWFAFIAFLLPSIGVLGRSLVK